MLGAMSESKQTTPQGLARVVALVINYNGKDVTLQTLASLVRLEYSPLDLVVIDNGSSDGSWQAIEEQFPQVTQLKVPQNHGISHGMNVGIRHALDGGYDYTLILNNDIEVRRAHRRRGSDGLLLRRPGATLVHRRQAALGGVGDE